MERKSAARAGEKPRGGRYPRILTFTVWEFVRIMVRLEADAIRKPAAKALLAAWAGPWRELDKELARLAAAHPQGYSALMMDSDVTVKAKDGASLREAARAAQTVAGELRASAKSEKDRYQRAAFEYEAQEMAALVKRLQRPD